MTDPAAKLKLAERITDYLSNGGLFNPESMEHGKVRDLLIECRQALSDDHGAERAEVEAWDSLVVTLERWKSSNEFEAEDQPSVATIDMALRYIVGERLIRKPPSNACPHGGSVYLEWNSGAFVDSVEIAASGACRLLKFENHRVVGSGTLDFRTDAVRLARGEGKHEAQ